MVSRSASEARSARATIHANVSPGVQYTASRICSMRGDGRLTVSRTIRGFSLFSLTRLVTAPPRRSWLAVGPAVVVVVGMDSSSHGDREDGCLLFTLATGLPSEEGCGPKCRPAASMAEKRGDGGPPDGHDPPARPNSAPLLANSSE